MLHHRGRATKIDGGWKVPPPLLASCLRVYNRPVTKASVSE